MSPVRLLYKGFEREKQKGETKVKLSEPRIEPLAESEWSDAQRKKLEPIRRAGQVYNVLGTLARHWDAYEKFEVWAGHVMGPTSTLAPRERELLILRIGWLCQAEYEWGQHVVFGRQAGLGEDEIQRIKAGPAAPGWDPFDATLLRAADELHADAFISNGTWAALGERYSPEQRMDVVFTVGLYNMVSMALNSFGVQLDEGIEGF